MQTVADVRSSQPYSSPHGMLPYFPTCRDALSGQPLYILYICNPNKVNLFLHYILFQDFKRITPATMHRSIELNNTICPQYSLIFASVQRQLTNVTCSEKMDFTRTMDFDFWGSPDCGKYENFNNHGTFGRWIL